MKTENFDDAIRRKLGSIDPPYNDDDITRVHRHVTGPGSPASVFRGYGALVAVLCSMFLALLLTWNFIEYRRNEVLNTKVAELDKRLIELKSQPALGKMDAKVPAPEIVSNTTGSTINVGKASKDEYANTTPSTLKKEQENKAVSKSLANSGTGKGIDSNPAHFQNTSNTKKGINNYNQATINSPAFADKATNKANDNSVSSFTENPSTIKYNNNTGTIAKTDNILNKNNSALTKQDNAPVENDKAIKTDQPKHDDTFVLDENKDSIIIANQKIDKAVEAVASVPIKKLRPGKPVSIFKGLSYSAGIEIESALHSRGKYGIIGEVILNKHWSAGTGIKMNYATENFANEEDFHHGKGKSFNDAYNIPRHDTFANIGLKYAVLEIPLRLSFRMPVSTNYTALFSIGTDLDISARQNIDFEHRGSPGPDEHKMMHIGDKHQVLLFNNVILSAGFQRQWGHITAQTSPYINPQLLKVDYKKNDLNAGIRLGAYYNF
jgi:hypothetical protein